MCFICFVLGFVGLNFGLFGWYNDIVVEFVVLFWCLRFGVCISY